MNRSSSSQDNSILHGSIRIAYFRFVIVGGGDALGFGKSFRQAGIGGSRRRRLSTARFATVALPIVAQIYLKSCPLVSTSSDHRFLDRWNASNPHHMVASALSDHSAKTKR